MVHRILIGLDGSEGAWRAVQYVASVFAEKRGVSVTLLHILPNLPPLFWDEGHIPSGEERRHRDDLVAEWKAQQEAQWEGVAAKARQALVDAGFAAHAISSRFIPKQYDTAEDIADEARAGGYDTIVLGRRGLGEATSLLLGSVSHKIVQYAKGGTVTIVG